MHNTLNEWQQDALVEAFNIAISSAAVSLSNLVREEVQLSVPKLEWLTVDQVVETLVGLADTKVSSVMQYFAGDIHSRALLMFPQSRALEVVRLMVGDLVSNEDLSELEQETVCEIGNILLNACMATLSRLLGISLNTSLPHYMSDTPRHLFQQNVPGSDCVLMIHITLVIERREIEAYLAFVLDAQANAKLTHSLNTMLQNLGLPMEDL